MNPFDTYKLQSEIIPGILEKEWEVIEKKIELVKPFTKTIHIDLLDGKFAPNTTWIDPSRFKKYSDEIFFEIHLMVENPFQYLQPFANAGCKRFIGQIEHMKDIPEFVAQGQILGEVGLAIDVQTPVENIPISYDDLDLLFVMTVKAGFSNQTFMPEMLEKVKKIREKSLAIPIEVDGGISNTTIVDAKEAGATRFVTTGFLFGSDNPHEQYRKLLQEIQ